VFVGAVALGVVRKEWKFEDLVYFWMYWFVVDVTNSLKVVED
jgi:hypothetical protein